MNLRLEEFEGRVEKVPCDICGREVPINKLRNNGKQRICLLCELNQGRKTHGKEIKTRTVTKGSDVSISQVYGKHKA